MGMEMTSGLTSLVIIVPKVIQMDGFPVIAYL